MSKSKYVLLASMALVLGTSCEKSSSEEFEEVNKKSPEKLISLISLVDPDESEKIEISYDDQKRLSSISNGTDASVLVYDNTGLTGVTGSEELNDLNLEALYKSPYDAFETGDVVEYDDNGNPSEILFFEDDYDYESDTHIRKQYSAELAYEDTPNLHFYTLKAAGLIDMLDKVRLNFSMQPQAQEIKKARTLLPNNNISSITYKDEEGVVLYKIETVYTYDADKYPTQVTVTSKSSLEDEDAEVYKVNYKYL